MSSSSVHQPSVLALSKAKGLQVVGGTRTSAPRAPPSFPSVDATGRKVVASPENGSSNLRAVLSNAGVVHVMTIGGQEVATVQPRVPNEKKRGIVDFYFSPLGNFLVTYEHHVKGAGNNVNLWYLYYNSGGGGDGGAIIEPHVVDGYVFSAQNAEYRQSCWKWTAGEEFLCRPVGNGVNVSCLGEKLLALRTRFLLRAYSGNKKKDHDVLRMIEAPTGEEVMACLKDDQCRRKLAISNVSQIQLSNSPILGLSTHNTEDAFHVMKSSAPDIASGLLPADRDEVSALAPHLEDDVSASVTTETAKKLQQELVDGLQKEEGAFFIAVFTPEAKGQPGKVSLFDLNGDLKQSVCAKSFYNASSVSMKWNFKGPPALLVSSAQDCVKGEYIDEEASYYGTTTLFHLSTSPTSSGPANLGEIQAAAWCPRRNEFLILSGRALPCGLQLISGANPSKVLSDFGVAEKSLRRNTLVWSPSGRHFLVAGLGNLAGDVDFWCVTEEGQGGGKNKTPKFAKSRTSNFRCCTNLSYSRCGQFVLGASMAPRVRADTCFRVYDFAGTQISDQAYNDEDLLYGARLMASTSSGENHDESSGSAPIFFASEVTFSADKVAAAKKQGDDASVLTGNNPSTKGAYVPPHLRNVKQNPVEDSSTANKNKKTNKPSNNAGGNNKKDAAAAEKSKAAQAAYAKQEAFVPPPVGCSTGSNPPGPATSTFAPAERRDGPPVDIVEEARQIENAEERLKKVKALRKKLTQIEKLKTKGAALSPEEREKVESETKILEAIKILES
ncbi:unnamed protein product [Amoebophrya sp. A25]|nr:unnamed protein product [Amoebophrya sp. A25]|eukprot:GSA25T00010883001.1